MAERSDAVQRLNTSPTKRIFFNVDGSALNNRLLNVIASTHFARGWDAHLWDVR